MGSPITNRIGMVFVPVRDVSSAAGWYGRILGLPIPVPTHGGTSTDVPMQGDAGLILDGTKREVQNSSQPRCFFWTDDAREAREFVVRHGVEIVRDLEDIGSVITLTFRDPDGNLLMVCQRKR